MDRLPENVQMQKSFLTGEILMPPSKSMAHRAVIAGSLGAGQSIVENISFSVDIKVTVEGMEKLGAKIRKEEQENGRYTLYIEGVGGMQSAESIDFDCAESGSTLRFLIPLGCLFAKEATFKGKGKLVERPLNVYYDIFDEQGIKYTNDEGKLPLKVSGALKAGLYEVRGDISSQFITGLLFALPLLDGYSEIKITTPLESGDYINLTLEVLKEFGIDVICQGDTYKIPGGQKYKSNKYYVEGDYSQAAFFVVGASLNGDLVLKGLKADSRQGDKEILELYKRMGGNITYLENGDIQIKKGETVGIEADCRDVPDIVPILTVLAALSKGKSRFTNLERLKIKESDRLKAISTELNKLGAKIIAGPDWLEIEGVDSLAGGTVSSWNDHRIAMSMAMAALRAEGTVYLSGANSVTKSFPDFWQEYARLGGKADEWHVG